MYGYFSYAAAYTKKTENGVPISMNTQHLQSSVML